LELEEEVVALFAGTQGFADSVPVDRVSDWERALLQYIGSSHGEIYEDIAEKKVLTTETENQLREAIEAFKQDWQD
jgi:F-type H+-transporting ATPase subunit alpha